MPNIEAGRVVAGRYRIQEQLGEGGMGSVWRAEHIALKSPVAVKFLNPAIADHPEMLERFLREAQSAAALRGTYVVQIFDYGVEDGMPYIAMELLCGESLQQRLERQRVLSPAELQRVFAQVARAVGKAHEAGIVHRDLKPDNIFIVQEADEEIAKVLDFGIAKVADNPLEVTTGGGTRTGAMLGTPYYMSPEQARGKKAVDHRTDLWALAIIAYECLVGRRAFDSEALGELVLQICTAPAPLPSQYAVVPKGFDDWFQRGANKDPEQRFQTVRQMVEGLDRALSSALSPSPVSGVGETVYAGDSQLSLSTHAGAAITTAPRTGKGSPLLWAALASVALIGGVVAALLPRDPPVSTAEARDPQPATHTGAAGAPPPTQSATPPTPPPVEPAPAAATAAPPAATAAPSIVVAPITPARVVPRPAPTKPAKKSTPSAPSAPSNQPAKPSAAELFSDRQ